MNVCLGLCVLYCAVYILTGVYLSVCVCVGGGYVHVLMSACVSFNVCVLSVCVCVLPGRPEGSDDGCDDRGAHVLVDVHLQQLQHHLHHGPVALLAAARLRVGAHDSGQVSLTNQTLPSYLKLY